MGKFNLNFIRICVINISGKIKIRQSKPKHSKRKLIKMKEFTKETINKYPYIKKNTLYFDIETTGFINSNSHIYMIGMFYLNNNILRYKFLFAENLADEVQILTSFKNILSYFDNVITFNGTTFDIPYIKWRADYYGIDISFQNISHTDMYRVFKSKSHLFNLKKYNQKSIEQFLGLFREDKYTGGDLIDIYKDYTNNPSSEKEYILTLHNINDLEGMAHVTNMHLYYAIFDWELIKSIDSGDIYEITLKSKYSFPSNHICSFDSCKVIYSSNTIIIQLPIISDTKKLFFDDYQNYYFLPQEDMAIHKSVGQFVCAPNKIKATKNTAYIKKTDRFIHIPFNLNNMFKDEYKDKTGYIPASQFNNSIIDKLLQHNFGGKHK